MDERVGWYALGYVVALLSVGVGLFASWASGKFQSRRKHECVGKVIRCVPRAGHVRVGGASWAGESTERADGTDILLRCACGRWWTQWMPGNWTVSDFERTEAVDMDKAISGLKEKPGE